MMPFTLINFSQPLNFQIQLHQRVMKEQRLEIEVPILLLRKDLTP